MTMAIPDSNRSDKERYACPCTEKTIIHPSYTKTGEQLHEIHHGSAAVAAGITEAVGWTIAVDFAKSAKSVWEHEYSDEEENIHQVPETPIAETYIDALRSAAEEFLSGKKTPTSEKDELKKLIKDIETVLDDLPDDHPLRDDFDRLAQLF